MGVASFMSMVIRIKLDVSPEQEDRLRALQQGFARLCNALAPVVKETRVWNRVALHHLTYKRLRESFPEMGSQMVCNAIYSVSRTCRMVFQNPASPLSLDKLEGKPLPLLTFADSCPVYFDRHTLSMKKGQLSMFTLDGRMRFQLSLDPEVEQRFKQQKLREIVLSRASTGYELKFLLMDMDPQDASAAMATSAESALDVPEDGDIPEYLIVEEAV